MNLYVDFGGLPTKSKDGALHIATVTINNCDVIF